MYLRSDVSLMNLKLKNFLDLVKDIFMTRLVTHISMTIQFTTKPQRETNF